MNTVHISASKDYDVLVGRGLLRSLGSYAAAIPNVKKVCIVIYHINILFQMEKIGSKH